MRAVILRLDAPEAVSATVARIGGKAAGLARLIALGLPVPPAVVLPADAPSVITEDDVDEIVRALGRPPFAVRSSGAAEDAAERSAAGQYESVMGVGTEDLAPAVERVRASSAGDRALAYSNEPPAPMAVVVQREVASQRAGVAFSRDPLTGGDVVVVECVFGHGERLVSGTTTPDRFRLEAGRVEARLVEKDGEHRLLRTLRDDEVVAIAELVRRAEAGLGHPVDVEFAVADGVVWLVQARAITAVAAGIGD